MLSIVVKPCMQAVEKRYQQPKISVYKTSACLLCSASDLGEANLQLVGLKAAIIVGVVAFFIAPIAASFLVPWKQLLRSALFIVLSICTAVGPSIGVAAFSYEFPTLIGERGLGGGGEGGKRALGGKALRGARGGGGKGKRGGGGARGGGAGKGKRGGGGGGERGGGGEGSSVRGSPLGIRRIQAGFEELVSG